METLIRIYVSRRTKSRRRGAQYKRKVKLRGFTSHDFIMRHSVVVYYELFLPPEAFLKCHSASTLACQEAFSTKLTYSVFLSLSSNSWCDALPIIQRRPKLAMLPLKNAAYALPNPVFLISLVLFGPPIQHIAAVDLLNSRILIPLILSTAAIF